MYTVIISLSLFDARFYLPRVTGLKILSISQGAASDDLRAQLSKVFQLDVGLLSP